MMVAMSNKVGLSIPHGELKGVSGAFPEVHGCDQHVLEVSGTSSR